eukprot:2329047-Pyramimonas_sp.AAC.1
MARPQARERQITCCSRAARGGATEQRGAGPLEALQLREAQLANQLFAKAGRHGAPVDETGNVVRLAFHAH